MHTIFFLLQLEAAICDLVLFESAQQNATSVRILIDTCRLLYFCFCRPRLRFSGSWAEISLFSLFTRTPASVEGTPGQLPTEVPEKAAIRTKNIILNIEEYSN